MDSIKNVEKIFKSNLDGILSNSYVMGFLKITLILYASQIAPTLPKVTLSIFNNTFFKIIAIALMAYIAQVDFQLAIILAIVFVLSINVISGRGLLESYMNDSDYGPFYENEKKYKDLLGKPAPIGTQKILDSQSNDYSSCDHIKMADLLTIFDNNHVKLQSTLTHTYKDLLSRMSENTPNVTRLIKIAKAIGIPGNIEFNDRNAPLIATYLINAGAIVDKLCRPPFESGMINR